MQQMMSILHFFYVIGDDCSVSRYITRQLSYMGARKRTTQSSHDCFIGYVGFQNLPQLATGILMVILMLVLLVRLYWKRKNTYDPFRMLISLPVVEKGAQQYVFLYARGFSRIFSKWTCYCPWCTDSKKLIYCRKMITCKLEKQLIQKGDSFLQQLEKI